MARKERRLRIFFLASEMRPLAKTGGLADVACSLPKAIQSLGHEVCALLPKYHIIAQSNWRTRIVFKRLPICLGGRVYEVAIERCYAIPHIALYLLDYPEFYDRERLYGYPDDNLRFALFARTALELMKALAWQPDVIHCNDWQTGLVPTYLNTTDRYDGFFINTATVFTVHNLAYTGAFTPDVLPSVGLPWDVFDINGIEFYGQVCYMKGGLFYADMLTTVSPRYAQEIQTEEFGEGFHGLLRARSDRLVGILNGVDYEFWNPRDDKFIPINYDKDTIEKKRDNKCELQVQMGLPVDPTVPLIGCVSRLATQKGFDLFHEIAQELFTKHNVQFVVLGAGEQRYHDLFEKLHATYPDKVGIRLGVYDEPLAHLIYAGADMFIMPSRYEPCGLGQMISLRYGTIPIVRYTGGLADTVREFNPDTGEGNGFGFYKPIGAEFLRAIERALNTYASRELWHRIVHNAMDADFSWKRSAQEYVEVYRRAVAERKATI